MGTGDNVSSGFGVHNLSEATIKAIEISLKEEVLWSVVGDIDANQLTYSFGTFLPLKG